MNSKCHLIAVSGVERSSPLVRQAGGEMAPVAREPSKHAAALLSFPVRFVNGEEPLKPNHS